MNNLITLTWCLILNFALNSNSFSQTYIGPVVGYDFQKVITTSGLFRIDLKNKGFGNASPLLGANLKQILFNQICLQISCNFTHKHVEGLPDGSLGRDLIYHYNYFKNEFLLANYWRNKWKISVGLTYNIVNNLYHEFIDFDFISNSRNNYFEKGYVCKLGLKYKTFEFEAYYYKRLGKPIEGDEIHFFHLHQIQSLGLRISYDFKIFDGCKKKDKLECPPLNKMALVE